MPSPPRASQGLFARKPVDALVAETERSGFRRALGPLDLTGIGIAGIIGAGIFVLLGQVARDPAGPAVVLSIVLAGVAAVLTAFAFAELASVLPVSGSVYDYAYATLGRFPAFMAGWLVLNAYAVGNMTVAVAWSEFFAAGLASAGWALPDRLAAPPGQGGLVNLPAAAIMMLVTVLTLPRVRETALINNLLVGLKIGLVLFVVLLGAFAIDPANWKPFSPGGTGGVLTGAAVLLFAYFGFDTVAAAAGEARNPRRDLPIGILASVGVATILYVAMGAVVTGMQRAAELESRAPLATAFRTQGFPWAAAVITVGALVAMTTVLFAFHYALARILHAMARDRFLPPRLARLHPATGTPWAVTVWSGLLTALGAAFLPLRTVADMAVVATVFVYILVAAGVLVLKAVQPDLPRRFKIHWTVPAAAIAVLFGIVYAGIGVLIHLAFAAWVGAGLVLYGFYAHARGAA